MFLSLHFFLNLPSVILNPRNPKSTLNPSKPQRVGPVAPSPTPHKREKKGNVHILGLRRACLDGFGATLKKCCLWFSTPKTGFPSNSIEFTAYTKLQSTMTKTIIKTQKCRTIIPPTKQPVCKLTRHEPCEAPRALLAQREPPRRPCKHSFAPSKSLLLLQSPWRPSVVPPSGSPWGNRG